MPERALPRRRMRPCRHGAVRAVPASGAHAEAPERPLVAALRWRELPRDTRGKWTVPGGANPPAGAPPVVDHWPPERRKSRPCRGLSTRACVTGVTPLAPNRPSAGIKTSPRPCLACTPNHRRAPPPVICAASVSSLLRPLPWLSEHAYTFPLLTPSLHACGFA
jgi:hypothetical protein